LRQVSVESHAGYCRGLFEAMASPCEVLVETQDIALAKTLTRMVAEETWRIQDKYSRYDQNSFLSKLNQNCGSVVTIDEESYQLFKFADDCYQLSDGLFDITSGILSRIWRFDGGNTVPSQDEISALLPAVGWQKVRLTETSIEVPKPMQLDFGGIGKEYAVDRCIQIIRQQTQCSGVVNLGGDLAVTTAKSDGQPWHIGIENPHLNIRNNHDGQATNVVKLSRGAVATSGDARRFVLKDGVRYSHIIDPKTGWPVVNAPRSVTVAATHCTLAGLLATLALLHGEQAEEFLTMQGVEFNCIR